MSLSILFRNARIIPSLLPCAVSQPVRHASLPTKHDLNLKDRVAIVTAATSGIGLAVAKRLAENGANVVISSRKKENVMSAVEKLRAEGLQVSGYACHVGSENDRKQLISSVLQKYGDINILVQNAGVNPHPFGIMDTPEKAIDKACDVHIKSNFRFVQEVFPHMKKSDKPCSIILTSSVSAYQSHFFPGIYAITKGAVNVMTRAFSTELSKHNIRINGITIGPIKTPFLDPVVEVDEFNQIFMQNIVMKRYGKPEEIAGMAAYLASDDSSYITGENHTIAGGVYCSV